MRRAAATLLLLALAAGCGEPSLAADGGRVDADLDPGPSSAVMAADRLGEDFFALPWPSDLRLDDRGRPIVDGFPNPVRSDIVDDLLVIAGDRPGWPTLPVAHFRFTAPLAPRSPDALIEAAASSPILILDVDPASPERGALVPAIAHTIRPDRYTDGAVLSVAPRPGWVLAPDRTYAVVVRTSAEDARGRPLEVSETMRALAAGEAPAAAGGEDARALYAPLWETLDTIGVARTDVASATVFTTGDVVADLFALSSRAVADHDVTLDGLHVDPDDGEHDRYCELLGTATLPQFQRGAPPFDEAGLFELGADGAPIVQRVETIPIVVTIPRGEMPAEGWPLVTYFHGSGGVASQLVDRGPRPSGGSPAIGQGPAWVVAEHGFAAFGSALPISPDRVPGASPIAYVNLMNLAMTRDLFRQGVIEQRLLSEALARIEIPPAALAGCDGATLPAGATAHRFDPDAFVAMGQSMGGMYTNLIGAVEPRYRAFVPTGAGGYWTYFILETEVAPGTIIPTVLGVPNEDRSFSHLHPALGLAEMALEPVEPFVSMPRLSRRPLPTFDARPVYEPVGRGDSYFPTVIYDAAALAYGHEQAGDEVWPEMQSVLALAGRDGILSYPVAQNLESEGGAAYTGVVVQYEGDGFSDPHDIFVQLPEVRWQYGCFFLSVVQSATGVGTLSAPMPGASCP